MRMFIQIFQRQYINLLMTTYLTILTQSTVKTIMNVFLVVYASPVCVVTVLHNNNNNNNNSSNNNNNNSIDKHLLASLLQSSHLV